MVSLRFHDTHPTGNTDTIEIEEERTQTDSERSIGKTGGQPPMTNAGQRGSGAKADGPDASSAPGFVDEIEVRGHIVDSLLLPKILDRILQMGGSFEIHECKIGVRRSDPSYARIGIRADSPEAIDAILGDLVEHGAWPVHSEDCRTVAADIAGAFPDGFYSTTNQRTQVRYKGRWIGVQDQEMDCGIVAGSRVRSGPMRADDPGDFKHADRGRSCGCSGSSRRATA